jgi:ubiquinone/menaquinone biosynthesis C-methylase UbiE
MVLLAVLALQAQLSTQQSPYKLGRASLDGIGKFYHGREIARVMGHEAAAWLDRPERDAEEATSVLLESLKLKPGMTVADIGAGSGYFTLPMAKQVAPNGKVLAVEIQREMLAIIQNKAKRSGIMNISSVLGSIKDPRLPARSVDLMLLVDVYHEFDHPYEMMSKMVEALKPGGRLVLVEYRGEDDSVPIKTLHKMTEAQVLKELKAFQVDFVENQRMLPWQHVLVFRRK